MTNSIKILAIFLLLILSNCAKESNDGVYTGITGLWQCEEFDEQGQIQAFYIDIDAVRGYEQVFLFSNFHNLGDFEFIRVTQDQSSLEIPRQNIGSLICFGNGSVSDDYKKILLEYSIDNGQVIRYYEAILTR